MKLKVADFNNDAHGYAAKELYGTKDYWKNIPVVALRENENACLEAIKCENDADFKTVLGKFLDILCGPEAMRWRSSETTIADEDISSIRRSVESVNESVKAGTSLKKSTTAYLKFTVVRDDADVKIVSKVKNDHSRTSIKLSGLPKLEAKRRYVRTTPIVLTHDPEFAVRFVCSDKRVLVLDYIHDVDDTGLLTFSFVALKNVEDSSTLTFDVQVFGTVDPKNRVNALVDAIKIDSQADTTKMQVLRKKDTAQKNRLKRATVNLKPTFDVESIEENEDFHYKFKITNYKFKSTDRFRPGFDYRLSFKKNAVCFFSSRRREVSETVYVTVAGFNSYRKGVRSFARPRAFGSYRNDENTHCFTLLNGERYEPNAKIIKMEGSSLIEAFDCKKLINGFRKSEFGDDYDALIACTTRLYETLCKNAKNQRVSIEENERGDVEDSLLIADYVGCSALREDVVYDARDQTALFEKTLRLPTTRILLNIVQTIDRVRFEKDPDHVFTMMYTKKRTKSYLSDDSVVLNDDAPQFDFGNRVNPFFNHFTMYKNVKDKKIVFVLAACNEVLSVELDCRLRYLEFSIADESVYDDEFDNWRVSVDKLKTFEMTDAYDRERLLNGFEFIGYGEWWYAYRGFVFNTIAQPYNIYGENESAHLLPPGVADAIDERRTNCHLIYVEFKKKQDLRKENVHNVVPSYAFFGRIKRELERSDIASFVPSTDSTTPKSFYGC
ncbi:hypothetical protein QAD02_001442 [Eretmocerus hayati]|uniref:Uncharacterized protein n=1 Tax=Eretmocerus hayati TaxID=131215 RepID=A0ACC2NH00_9HYME|nr:hypothetical protein QAD02_001442 [Eretmocerus hayati]